MSDIQRIKNMLVSSKGYYSYDHAICTKTIKDVIWAYKKIEEDKTNRLEKRNATRRVLVEKSKRRKK